MAKSTSGMAPLKSEKGQISIFFSASLIVLVSIIAFVINVGLFVKAKINLHNATDAAAFAGASVQARQLSRISYLNWEMRNIFKEWMYKYYVIGNLNVSGVDNPAGSGVMNFRLDPDENIITGITNKDPYNFPAVCIHVAGSQTNVCKRYAVPGLPEFGGYNLPGSEEASRAFIDSLIGSKVNDCVERSKLNMFVASTWAFNVLSTNAGQNPMSSGGPAILADRQGAWPKAIELAMRIRNLEFAFNRNAESGGVCAQQSPSGQISCGRLISDIETSDRAFGTERVVKAFYSGYRNLTNSNFLSGAEQDDEMKATFTLTELPPNKPPMGTKWDASNLLVPSSNLYPKQWLDLKLMMVNYATFFAALIPRADSATSGACDISKVAIPVPGYPLGFYKNPDVLTYYAVKGEAEFIGMFNPFNTDAIKLTAYAAAKPFGGRVGPMLFTQRRGETYIRGRTDNLKFRSVPYLVTLDVVDTKVRYPNENPTELKDGKYGPGVPLPINFPNKKFWLTDESGPVGGMNNNDVQFGIPNLVYDFIGSDFTAANYSPTGQRLVKIQSKNPDPASDPKAGLYSVEQFRAFKGTLGGMVTPDMLNAQIARVRAATKYEMANYMIPTPADFNKSQNADAFGFITGAPRPVGDTLEYTTNVFAPLFSSDQTDVLWKSSQDVVSTVFEFMRQQSAGIDGYINSLNEAAKQIYAMAYRSSQGATGSRPSYLRAALGVSDINLSGSSEAQVNSIDVVGMKPKTCASLAGQFLQYYYGAADLPGGVLNPDGTCPTPLGDMLREYFTNGSSTGTYSANHYVMKYYLKSGQGPDILSAYVPGPFNGVSGEGTMNSPFPGLPSEMMRRNFYSTKFVTLDSLQKGKPGYQESITNFVIYSEGDLTSAAGFDRSQTSYDNDLVPNADLSSVKY